MPILSEQYLRDQLIQHTEHPLDKIFKQCETHSKYNVPNNAKNRRREVPYMNNYNDMQTSNTQGHTISNVSNNQEHTRIVEQTPIK